MESSAQNSGTEGGVEAPRVLYTGARAVVSNAGQASRPVSGRPSASRPVSGRSARPVSGRATSSRPLSGKSTFYSGAEDLEQLRQRFVLLEGDRRAYFETSQWTMQQNRETVVSLKQENREMKKKLSAVNSKRDAQTTPTQKQIKMMEKKVHELRSAYDKAVKERTQGAAKLSRVKENLQSLEKDRSSIAEKDSPVLRNIRLMENRLDKALVKHNEAASIGRTYESIISRLKDERVTFDSQLKALEDAVKAKASDAEQLASMAAEAQAAKEEAIGQLRAVVGAVERERAHRAKELAERRAQVEAAEADRAGGDPEELERCRAAAASYDEAFRRVQDATGVVNLSEFVDRFLAQENVKQELKAMESQTLHEIDVLNGALEGLKSNIAECRFMGTGNASTREEMDKMGDAIKAALARAEEDKAKQDKLGRQMVGAKAGLAHLQDLLAHIPKKRTTVSNIQDSTGLLDILLHIGDQMFHVIDVCGRDPHALQAVAQLRDDPSCFYDPTDINDPSPSTSPTASSVAGRFCSEDADVVLGVGTSIADGEGINPTSGITKSVVIDRKILKTESERVAAAGPSE